MISRSPRFLKSLLVILAVSAAVPAWAICPAGYSPYLSGCRADLPSTDFYYKAPPMERYPVCGSGRVPVTDDGAYSWSTMSSSGVPKSSFNVTTTETYNYLQTPAAPPVYGYQSLRRCICVGKTIAETPVASSYGFLGPLAGTLRVLPDVFDIIATQTSAGNVQYGMVAISNDNASDGRRGDLYSVGKSKCGCPNLNEVAVSVDPTAPATDPIGVRCVPAVNGPNRVLMNFDPAIHDNGANSIVMNRTNEVLIQSTTNVVTDIQLPKSLTAQSVTQPYKRKIWNCALPYRLKVATGDCIFYPEQNACDAGDPLSGSLPSEVSPFVTGVSKEDQFLNTQNKKLGACMNEYGTVAASVKFDCIENVHDGYATFDDLWASTDKFVDGGQPNAFRLTDAGGRVLTGFYKIDGTRCTKYNEFVGDVYRGRLTKSGGSWTFAQTESGPIARPSSAMPGVAYLTQRLTDQGFKVPVTPQEKYECPILIRAALVVTCPQNPPLPSSQKTLEIRDSLGVLQQRRCAVASNVQVHVKVEQVFVIENQPPLKTIDTVAGGNQTAVISVSQINGSKYGEKCPPGTVRANGVCVY